LGYLLRTEGRVVSKEELIEHVWQCRALGDNVISVCVAKLRRVLGGKRSNCIASVYGRGYRFVPDVVEIQAPLRSQPPLAYDPTDALFVGRDAVLARLQSTLARTCAGRGGACALLGEAGIGKTRAAEVLERHAVASGMRVSWGRCHAFGDAPPLWPFLQVLRGCSAELPVELRAEALEGAVQAPEVESDATFERWEPRSRDAWRSALAAMNAAFLQLTAARPWLVVLEDVQWADAASLELLAHLLVERAQRPLLFLLTVRDTELPRDRRRRRALDYVLGHRDCERIQLGRLTSGDVDAYTTRMFGAPHTALSAAVFARSEGSPFFMVELLRPFADGPAPDAAALALSGPALDIVRQALAALDTEIREVLAAAAVIGRSFDLGLLAAATGRSPEALLELLDEPMSNHLIVAAPGSQTLLTFGHDLMRSTLYDDLPQAQRSRLHARVADALEQRGEVERGVDSVELAHHRLSALPSGEIASAIASTTRAARSSWGRGAYAEGAALLRRALDAQRLSPTPDARTRCELLFGLAA
ncbi:MAG TPA: AAA family ATPase, partial [Polyangiales bacterium]|nr:AAA family ATPase [Polyangiales bacterium]